MALRRILLIALALVMCIAAYGCGGSSVKTVTVTAAANVKTTATTQTSTTHTAIHKRPSRYVPASRIAAPEVCEPSFNFCQRWPMNPADATLDDQHRPRGYIRYIPWGHGARFASNVARERDAGRKWRICRMWSDESKPFACSLDHSIDYSVQTSTVSGDVPTTCAPAHRRLVYVDGARATRCDFHVESEVYVSHGGRDYRIMIYWSELAMSAEVERFIKSFRFID